MARVKGVTKSAVSQKMSDAIFQYKKYKDLSEIVDQMVESLKQLKWQK